MSVLPVYRTQIPSSSPLFESSSSEFCASSGGHEREAIEQASSRLAARLERSEYKRSRGKRLHKHRSSSSLLGKTILSDDRSKRKSSAPGKLHFSVAENGSDEYIKQDLEAQEEPFFETCYSQARNAIKDSDEGHSLQSNFPARPKSWHGSSQSPSLNFARYKAWPVSMQEVSPDKGLTETNTSKIDSIDPRLSVYTAEPFKSHSLPHYIKNSDNSKPSFRNEHLATSMSRSLSSSVSSYVDSVEEQDAEHHGVYSAYDVASRSPYSGLAHRHFSQSSLSSSSASWNHSNPSLGHLTPKTSRESIHQSFLHGKTSEPLDHWDRKSFAELPPVSETGAHQLKNTNTNSIKHVKSSISPQEQSFSSTCNIHLSKISTSAAPVLEQSNKPTVTNNHLSPEPTSQLHLSNVTSHRTEKRINHKYSGETHDEDDQVESSAKHSPEGAVFQSQSYSGLGINSESPSQDLPVTHGSYSEGILSQSNEYQRQKKQESQNISVMHAASTAVESYQTPLKSNTPSVKDLAKRFSGFHGEEGHGDMRKVKAETWPKLVLVHSASYHENELTKYTVHSENSLSGDAASISKGMNSRSESRNQHKTNLVNTDERQNLIVINAERSNSQHFELEENNGVTSKSKTIILDKEKLPKAVTVQSSEVKEFEESISSSNVVYRRNEVKNRVEGKQPQKVLPRPKSFPVVSRNELITLRSDASHSTQDSVNSEGVSHRLSLQELIRLHEDRIATHAQSARASSHTQIYLKRPISDLFSIKSSEKAEQSPGVNDQQRVTLCNHDPNELAAKQSEDLPKNGELRSSHIEIKEVEPTSSSQIKVIELSDKNKISSDVIRTKDISARVKRHRTIGIVGVRQHTNHVYKPKRHTAIGIVSPKGTQPDSKNLKHPVDEEVLIGTTTCSEVELPVQGTIEDLPELTKNKRDVEKGKPVFIDQTEHGKMDDEDEVDRLRREEQKGSDNEANETLLPPLVSQESQHKKEGKCFPGVSQSAQDIVIKPTSQYVTLSSQYNTVTSSSQNKEEELDVYKDSSRHEPTTFGSTKTQPEQDVTIDKPKHLPLDQQTPNTKTNESNNSFIFPKAYSSTKSIPIAQVSPVSPVFPFQQLAVPLSENLMRRSPLSTPSSAQEMYETRLALLNLVPSSSSHTALEMQGSRMPDNNNYTISTPSYEQRQQRNELFTASVNIGEVHFDSRTEGLYLQLINQLRRENHELREKFDLEKREWRQKYEEQKKVANAYQKLEDRYRRRVHELQDALSNCSCQSFMVTKDSSILVATTGSEKLNELGKLSNNSGLRIIDELEEWITEQSHNATTDIVNASHDSLISSSTDMTAMGWNYAYDMGSGNPNQIDHVNGTHV